MDFAYPLIGLALAHLLAVASLGPSFVLIAQTAAGTSRRAALVATLGLTLGAAIWAAAALFALQALFTRFDWLYVALRIGGGAYLVWIGYLLIRHAGQGANAEPAPATAAAAGEGAIFVKALLLQLSNPKVIVFFAGVFAALLPRDASPGMSPAALAVVAGNEFGYYALVSMLFSRDGARRVYDRARMWIERITGGVLALLGLKLVFDR